MEIGVTQTIQKRLKNQDIHQPYEQTTELAFCWDTHLVKLGRRNVLLIANVSNRFMIAMMDIEPRNKDNILNSDAVIASSDPSVCEIKDGKLIAKKVGKANIKMYFNGYEEGV